ncbi:MAG: hypothetical protein KDI13_03195 [Alphaproteobacteria bacterium]|nr:hypothetical protein [Alphaproteobacteria bacterium]
MSTAENEILQGAQDALDYLRGDKTKGRARGTEKYALNPENWRLDQITDADTAACILLGLEPSPFLKFKKDRWHGKRQDEGFVKEYSDFVWDYYWKRTGADDLCNIHNKMKAGLWHDNFKDFAQCVYESGYLFRDEVMAFLNANDCKLHYPADNKRLKRYQAWAAIETWSLDEAVNLYKGRDPDSKEYLFTDLRQPPRFLGFAEKGRTIVHQPNMHGQYGILEERLEVLIDAPDSQLTPTKKGRFQPKQITDALQKITVYKPVPILLQVLEQEPEEQETANQNIPKTNKRGRITPFHSDIGEAIEKLKKENGQLPSSTDVLKEMKINGHEYPFFVKEDKNSKGEAVIWHKQASGQESTITKKRFGDIVSEFRTGKKQLSFFLG